MQLELPPEEVYQLRRCPFITKILKLFHGALSVKFQSLKHLDFTLKTQELYLLLIEV